MVSRTGEHAPSRHKRHPGSVPDRTEPRSIREGEGVPFRTDASQQPTPVSAECLLRARELAALLAISIRTVWRLTAAGDLPAPVRFGGTTRWRHSDVVRFIARQSARSRLTGAERL